jgi:hypothetical protein
MSAIDEEETTDFTGATDLPLFYWIIRSIRKIRGFFFPPIWDLMRLDFDYEY